VLSSLGLGGANAPLQPLWLRYCKLKKMPDIVNWLKTVIKLHIFFTNSDTFHLGTETLDLLLMINLASFHLLRKSQVIAFLIKIILKGQFSRHFNNTMRRYVRLCNKAVIYNGLPNRFVLRSFHELCKNSPSTRCLASLHLFLFSFHNYSPTLDLPVCTS